MGMTETFPVQCACGGNNVMHDDLMINQTIVKCECGTMLTINNEEWYEAFEVARMREEMAYCCCESERMM